MKKVILTTLVIIFAFFCKNVLADDTAAQVQAGIGILGGILSKASKSKDNNQQAAQENKGQNQTNNEQNVSVPVFGGNPVVLGENEGKASATVRSICTAIETYAYSHKGEYPATGDEVTQYISSFETYNNKTRALLYFFKGKFSESIKYNFNIILVGPLITLLFLINFVRVIVKYGFSQKT